MDLYAASKQWANRPPDERFETLQELAEVTRRHRDSAKEAILSYSDLRLEAAPGGDLAILGKANVPGVLTHWAFGQLATRIGAPAGYLRRLPATLAAQNLNHGLRAIAAGDAGTDKAKVLAHANGQLVIRAFTGPDYARIWNADIADRLLELPEHGWRVPPARPAFPGQPGSRIATAQDVLKDQGAGGGGLSIKVGDTIAPAGLYASDHDLFAFLVNESRRLDDGTESGLSRGFFISNSEVGAMALRLVTFLYRHVCGNHIVWSASGVQEIRLRHVGTVGERWARALEVELTKYADASASDDEAKIAAAQRFRIADTKDAVLDTLFERLKGDVSRKAIEEAYTAAAEHEDTDGDPRTAWGAAQGLTRVSQLSPYADERLKLDKAAGRVLELVF